MPIAAAKKVAGAKKGEKQHPHQNSNLCTHPKSGQVSNTKIEDLLHQRKLFLVLDLDHTLLHAAELKTLSPKEKYLTRKVQDPEFKDMLFEWGSLLIKLRPFVHAFLKEANNLFQMCIYTMSDGVYAKAMAKLLDPRGVYFGSRVFSRENCIRDDEKNFDVVGAKENCVLILDDTQTVWRKQKENLMVIEKYMFFAPNCPKMRNNYKSLSETKSDEGEADGALAVALQDLKQIHSLFFDPEHEDNFAERDVRKFKEMVS
ncbi:hypothetical protein RJ640_030827 [Escallonia rubra]|uniref:RNA polymerase II C-terminal domain phosphatase-like n=1 Tax=Escallonia rubra TaxID=112253 RepID=A0AA88U5D8_9ASTE|nr:hypothetical protein RJ640_030827 [Escallonia rubra]